MAYWSDGVEERVRTLTVLWQVSQCDQLFESILMEVSELRDKLIGAMGILDFVDVADVRAVVNVRIWKALLRYDVNRGQLSDCVKYATDIFKITSPKPHGLRHGDTARLIRGDGFQVRAAAVVLNYKTFTVKTKEPLGDKVIVCGKIYSFLTAVVQNSIITMKKKSATEKRMVSIDDPDNVNLNIEAAWENMLN